MISGEAGFPFASVTMGGTFNALHIGHREYLEIGCRIAQRVIVHVTADEFAAVLKPYKVKPYPQRVLAIEKFLGAIGGRVDLRPLESNEQVRDFCVASDIAVALVEPAYLALFQDINIERRLQRREEMYILVKPRTIVAGTEISSRFVLD